MSTRTNSAYCFTCQDNTDQVSTYRHGQQVEVYCTECGTADHFPYDDED